MDTAGKGWNKGVEVLEKNGRRPNPLRRAGASDEEKVGAERH